MNKRILEFAKLPLEERIKVIMLFGVSLMTIPHCGLLGSLYSLGDQYVETMVDMQSGKVVHIGIADYSDLNKYAAHIDLDI